MSRKYHPIVLLGQLEKSKSEKPSIFALAAIRIVQRYITNDVQNTRMANELQKRLDKVIAHMIEARI